MCMQNVDKILVSDKYLVFNSARMAGWPRCCARVAELVDALDLGSSRVTCESSSLSSRTIYHYGRIIYNSLFIRGKSCQCMQKLSN
jgi:hypothetical protein